MSKDNNQFGIDYAYPGLCSLCHSEIAEFDGSKEIAPGVVRPKISTVRDGNIEKPKMKPNYTFAVVELDDNSAMTVNLCGDCETTSFTPENMDKLMESEINGWAEEMDALPGWPQEKKKDHMEKYSKRYVTDRRDKPWNKDEKDKIKKPKKDKLKRNF